MQKKSFQTKLFPGAKGLFAALLVSACQVSAKLEHLEPRPFDTILSKVVAKLISTRHYTRQPLNDKVSQHLFNEFFATLDRDRRFFLASDIEEFSSYRNLLDNQLFAGNLEFAFKVYERFQQRVDERMAYARERLKEPFDFTVDEELTLDRSESPWAESKQELDEIWRRQLKNRVLIFTLMQEETDEENRAKEAEEAGKKDGQDDEKKAGETDGDSKTDQSEAPFVQKDPVTRVLDAQERFLSYIEENESVDVLEMYLSSLTRIYDPHSSYMAPMTEEDFDINMKLSLEGIGAMLTTEDGYVKITELVDGGPSDLDGRLKPGDRIVAVAQKGGETVDVVDMPLRKVVRLIRGKKGSVVFLSIIEAGKSLGSVPTTVDIVRDEVKLTEKSAKSEMKTIDLPPLNPKNGETGTQAKIMVIKLPSFYCDFDAKRQGKKDYRSASRDVRKLLEDGREQDIDGVILDLRSNGGGSLDEAIEMAGLFFPEGPVVQVKEAGFKRRVYDDRDGETVYAGPLAVLVNRMSASASEIVAAAIQDHHRGIIIGDAATHGKGTVQTVMDLTPLFGRDPVFRKEKTGSLKFTIAKFYRVNGESTQRRGVLPDITFPSFTDHMELGETSLEHALRWDNIDPLDNTDEIDITPYLPTLKTLSAHRVEKDPEFAKHNESVAKYGELRSRKTTPLNIDVRRKLMKEETEWIDEIRSTTFGESDPDQENDDEDAEEDRKDLVLDESLRITADLISLQKGDWIAQPKTIKIPGAAKNPGEWE